MSCWVKAVRAVRGIVKGLRGTRVQEVGREVVWKILGEHALAELMSLASGEAGESDKGHITRDGYGVDRLCERDAVGWTLSYKSEGAYQRESVCVCSER